MANQVARSGGDGGHYTMATCVMMVLVSMATYQKHFPQGSFGFTARQISFQQIFILGCALCSLESWRYSPGVP